MTTTKIISIKFIILSTFLISILSTTIELQFSSAKYNSLEYMIFYASSFTNNKIQSYKCLFMINKHVIIVQFYLKFIINLKLIQESSP
jgi:hypothetical protein